MVYHTVAVSTQLKSVALSTLFPSLPNKCHSSDVSQFVALSTFVNCRTSDEMWSDVLNLALPTSVNSHNYDEMWSDVLNVALPTFVNCLNSDKMWSNVLNVARPTFLYYLSFDVSELSQVRRLQGVGRPTAVSI